MQEHSRQCNSQPLPHIVQVYRPSAPEVSKQQTTQVIHISHSTSENTANLTYQAITVQPLSVTEPSHYVNVTEGIQSQQLRPKQMTISQEYTNTHLPQPSTVYNYKQLVVNGEVPSQYDNYSRQFDYIKNEVSNKCAPTINESEVSMAVESKMYETHNAEAVPKLENLNEDLLQTKKKRTRSPVSNPSKWACNVRRSKHQRGEAYISRRGKLVPEKKVRNTKDCLKSCKYKCSALITDSDREHLFKSFYSLSSNEKKHFLLNTTERCQVKSSKKDQCNRRKYSFKYFFLLKAVRFNVCKNFYLGTLAISQKPVYNVHSGKNDWNIPKPDGRGQSEASTHSLPAEIKDRVRRHIMSFKTIDLKPLERSRLKKQYIGAALSIKQMYKMYQEHCRKDNFEAVKESMYRKILKNEFNVHFKKVKVENQLCAKCKGPVNNNK